jgi:YD repeat-containing protein
MVSIFTGAGSGFERGSGSVLGGTGLLGASSLGRGGEQVFLNAANGNLLISRQDEFLVGRGPDVAIARTYNSLADAGDDNNDNWRQSTDRRVSGLTGTLNAAGSTVKRVSGDGAVITYTWDGAKSAYVATDGSGAHDTLTQATGVWTWTDGSSRITETYTAHGTDNWRIATQADTDGNTLTFSYTGANLTRITTANGDYVDYTWSGANITAIVTQAGTTLTRTRYEYDGANRLITVFTDLTPNNIIDTTTYATSYTYHGATKLVASITQTDGSRLEFTYAAIGGIDRITSVKQWADEATSRTTLIDYNLVHRITTITDPAGAATNLVYDAAGNLIQTVQPAPVPGANPIITAYAYNAAGDVTQVRRYDGFANLAANVTVAETGYTRDASGNALTETDGNGNTIIRTYGARNELLTETRTGSNTSSAAAQHTTRYVYDDRNRLRFVLTAEGRVSRYWYDGYGQMVSTTEYRDHFYDVSGLSASTAPSESQMHSWHNAIADHSTTRIVQNTHFDARGQMVQQVIWGGADAAGNPSGADGYSHHSFSYDQAGKLLGRMVTGRTAETFVYDGLGRLIAQTGLDGATTLTIYRDGTGKVDTVTIPSGGNLLNPAAWPSAGDNARGPNLIDNTKWAGEKRGENLVDLGGWRTDLSGLPEDYAQPDAWLNPWGHTAETRWARAIGPNGQEVAVIQAGQSDNGTPDEPGGGNFTNAFTVDTSRAYEFAIDVQWTGADAHWTFFGLQSAASDMVRNAATGAVEGNPYFTITSAASSGLQVGKWYRIVGYVLPEGFENIPVGGLGGVYDVETGGKVQDVTNYRWNEASAGDTAYARFFNYYGEANQGFRTNFYKPEVRQINVTNGYAIPDGWLGETTTGDETRWARVTGPDGSKVWAIQAGQTDTSYEGGGGFSNEITIDGKKTYEFTYYFRKSDLTKHSIYFGLSGNSGTWVNNAASGTPDSNPYFFAASTSWQASISSDRWYKVVGYVFAEGSKPVSVGTTGGVFDTVTGQKVYDVNNYIWSESRTSNQVYSRFFDFYDETQPGYSTYFYKPEIREFDTSVATPSGPAHVPGWNNYYYSPETRWERIAGPDGRPVMAMKAGQDDSIDAGGGNLSNQVTIDPNQTYEFSLYFQVTDLNKHPIYFGLSDSSPPYVLNAQSGAGDSNPYFIAFTPSTYQVGRWYKIVGYVLPQGSGNIAAGAMGGVYDTVTGQKVQEVNNFRWNPGRPSNDVLLRFFNHYNQVNQGLFTYFYGASIRSVTDTTGSSMSHEGYVVSNSYNRAGELLSSSDSGRFVAGGTTQYLYDRRGRPRMMTDATGNKFFYLYDDLGRKIADIQYSGHNDSTRGELVEYRYDANGRVTATVRYANRLSAEQMTALADASVDVELAAIRPAAYMSDIWTWTVYDKDGRILEAINGDGGVTAYNYDASGRLIRTTAYVNKLSAGQLDAFKASSPMAVVLPTADAARDSVARTFYDKDGNLVGVLDGEGYLTRTFYDKAGQKIEEYATANAIPVAVRGTGTLEALVNSILASANDQFTRYVYDGQGHLRYAIDGLNRVTEYGYASNGVTWDSYGPVRTTTRYAGTLPAPGSYTFAAVKTAIANAGLASNPNNRTSYNVYDPAGRVAYAVDALGSVVGYTYDDLGQVLRTTRYATPLVVPSLPWKESMDAWAATDGASAYNRVTRTYYSDRGELIFTVDAEGYVTRFEYDAEGRKTREVRWNNAISVGDSATIGQVYDLIWNNGTWVDTQYGYDPNGRLAYVIDPEGVRTSYYYFANGTLGYEYRANGTADLSITTRFYDKAGRVSVRYEGYGTPEQTGFVYTYDGLGNVISIGDPISETTRSYDRAGRLLSESRGGSTTAYEYNAFDEVVKTTDARGFASYNYYDRLGRLTMARDTEDHLTETSYTAFGEVLGVTRRYNRTTDAVSLITPPTAATHTKDATTSFEYDKLGRVTKTTDAEGYYETYQYNAFGDRIRVVNKLGGATGYDYHPSGRLYYDYVYAPVHDSSGAVAATAYYGSVYYYDARGNVVRRVEAYGLPEQRETRYFYDKADRLIRTEHPQVLKYDPPSGGDTAATPVSTVAYDKRGNAIEKVDPNGARTLFWYDDLDRVTVELDALGTYRAWTYDARGNVLTSRVYDTQVSLPATGGAAPTAPGGTWRETVNSYDALDRLLTRSIIGVETGYWNDTNWVSSTAAIVTAYDYDAAGNVVKVTDANGGAIFSWYDKLGRKVAEVDQENHLTAWTRDADGNVLNERRYTTKVAGTPVIGTAPSVATHADDRVTMFTYDRNGRRRAETREGVVAWTVNPANGQLATASTNATISYLYNGLGQVVYRAEATGESVDYGYDLTGRLTAEVRTAYTDQNGNTVRPTVRYYYNANGDLVRTSQGTYGSITGDRVTTYTYGLGGRLRLVTNPDGTTRMLQYDLVGNLQRDQTEHTRSDGTTYLSSNISYSHDLLGRVATQLNHDYVGGVGWLWTDPLKSLTYNAHGEVTAIAVGGMLQQQNKYDAAGRIWATDAGDGVWKYLGYDRNGNQTIAITSGGASLSNKLFGQALALVGQADVNATFTVYDKRGLATRTIDEQRQLSGSVTQALVTRRWYNGFGEVIQETDALGSTTNYAYNTMGRLIQKRAPEVNWRSESGGDAYARPTETYYYDLGGRMIGTRDANQTRAAVQSGYGAPTDAFGFLTTRLLLAGSGYGDGEALVTAEFHPDGGVARTFYDHFGDARTLRNELGSTNSLHLVDIATDETRTYDAMGRVASITRRGGLLTDHYVYDGLGRQIRHWNSLLGSGNAETTDYDTQGRVLSQRAFGGEVTTTSYVWSSSLVTSGLGTFGGWTVTVSTDADRASGSDGIHASVESQDLFGRALSKADKGGQVFSYTYDLAGRLVSETSQLNSVAQRAIAYSYYNGGQLRQMVSGDVPVENSNWARRVADYEYDAAGRLTREKLVSERGEYQPEQYVWVPDPNYPESPIGEGPGEWVYMPDYYHTPSFLLQDGRADYDAAGRISRYRDVTTSSGDRVDKYWTYDLVGNVRSIATTYLPMQADGSLSATTTGQTWWYRYDAMNRLVTTKGSFVGSLGSGSIVRGGAGTDITYNGAGQRATAQTGYGAQEVYSYTAQGLVTTVTIGGVTRATTSYDALGRVDGYAEYDGSGGLAYYRYSIAHDARGLVLSEKTQARQGSDWVYAHTVNNYSATGTGSASAPISWSGQTGTSTGSLLHHSETKYWLNGSSSPVYGSPGNYSPADLAYADAYTAQSYIWRDGALQNQVNLVNRDGASDSTYTYDRDDQLTHVHITGGTRPRTIWYTNSIQGQVLGRGELDNNWSQNDPRSLTYLFGGRQMGVVGNDGTGNVDYATAIAGRTAAPGTGAFRNGATTASIHADFDANFQALNGDSPQGMSSYTVGAGDSLATIAAALWGDASLWYKLAEANGLGGADALTPGRSLVIPGNVGGIHHNATTFKPYDPAEAIGNTSPNTPKPPRQSNKCGAFGAILLAVIAVAVTAVTAGAAIAALVPGIKTIGVGMAALAAGKTGLGAAALVGIGAAAGAAGSIASQGVGVATGLQDKFSWKGVALSALSGGVNGGLGTAGLGGGFLGGAARGLASSALTQGAAVATGLSNKFDWAGVAAAGLGGGVSGWTGGKLGGSFGATLASGGAGGIANAATRSLANGTSFGDNLIAALPDVIGSTIGNALAGAVARGGGVGGGKGTSSKADVAAANSGGAMGGPYEPILKDIGSGSKQLRYNAPGQSFDGEAAESTDPKTPEELLALVGTDLWLPVNGQAQLTKLTSEMAERMIAAAGGGEAIVTTNSEGWLGQAFGFSTFGAALSGFQPAMDNLSSTLTGASDWLYEGYLGLTAGRAPSSELLMTDFAISGVHSVFNGLAAIPGAFANPGRTLGGIAGGIDSWLLDDRSVGQVANQNLTALYNSTPREIAQGTGAFAGDAGLIVSPLRFAPTTRFGRVGWVARSPINDLHVAEMMANGVKFTPDALLATGRSSSTGQVIFLETGNARAGLQHIVDRHGSDFARIGVSETQIPEVVMRAATEGKLIGYQGADQGRGIYEILLHQQNQRVAVTVSSNGFIVGANPAGRVP